jgi:hypothetical protein
MRWDCLNWHFAGEPFPSGRAPAGIKLASCQQAIGATFGCETGLIEEPEARAWRFANSEPTGTLKQQGRALMVN